MFISISDYYQYHELTDGQVGSGLLHLSVESHKQPISVISGVKTNIGGLIAASYNKSLR